MGTSFPSFLFKKRSELMILQRIYLYKRIILVTSLPEVEPESMKD